jgi:acyl-CoA synthetase (AMP-forming)/AMP-acid ligase II
MATHELAVTLPQLIRRCTAEHSERILFVCDDERLSFGEADRRSQRVAKALLAIGARKGTRVGLIYPNCADFVIAFLGATRIGAVAVPYSTLSTAAELKWLLANADVEVVLSVRRYRNRDFVQILSTALPELDLSKAPPLMSPSAPSLRTLFFEEDDRKQSAWSMPWLLSQGESVSDALLKSAEADVSPADPAIIVHTSGSTSVPKGVMHMQGTLLEHLGHLNKIRNFAPDDVLFSNAPFFWIGGLVYCLIGALEAGGRLVCSNSHDAAATLDLLEREKPTLVTGFPQSVAHLVKDPSYPNRDFSAARRGNMPAIMAPDVRPADLELRHNKLGTTETASVYLTDEYDGDVPESLRGSFGRPTPGFEVQIIDPDSGAQKPVGEVGEIRLRGPYVMEGYVGRERHETFEPDGWYRSGDLAYRNGEGYVFYKGRLNDMIKTSGANVSPREVEGVIGEVIGGLVHVLGIDDPERGQIVVAAIVPPSDAKIDTADLVAQLKNKISSYKIPRRFLILQEAEVPMMSSGKLDKRKLAELFRAT